eukprot:7835505-Prorocentrum_lima.AAC.1
MSHSCFIAAKWATGAWATGMRKMPRDPSSGGKKGNAAGCGEPNGPNKGCTSDAMHQWFTCEGCGAT